VVCQRWWQKLLSSTQSSIGDWTIDVDNALAEFYAYCIREAINGTQIKENEMRKWCQEKLITSTGTRGIIHRDRISTGGMNNRVVDILESKYLIRRE